MSCERVRQRMMRGGGGGQWETDMMCKCKSLTHQQTTWERNQDITELLSVSGYNSIELFLVIKNGKLGKYEYTVCTILKKNFIFQDYRLSVISVTAIMFVNYSCRLLSPCCDQASQIIYRWAPALCPLTWRTHSNPLLCMVHTEQHHRFFGDGRKRQWVWRRKL